MVLITRFLFVFAFSLTIFFGLSSPEPAWSQPTMIHHKLAVNEVVSGLVQPIGMAFLGDDDFLVLEKSTGRVQRVVGGVVQPLPVLDLAVNSNSERGLLGIALHPNFPTTPGVYLFWTESIIAADSTNSTEVPLLGNRVDRFVWDGSLLTFDQNLIRMRAFQEDTGQPPRGNHNGGVIRFGPDGKLYILIGDAGRRGQMQNLADGPLGDGSIDDAFGGPEPDDAHLTGVILRLNDDGSIPTDNPFYDYGSSVIGEEGANLQKIFAFGIRNSFGMAFDPESGVLWTAENGDDSFDEINRVEAGHNGGWVQIMGPVSRIAEYKAIETSYPSPPGDLQQIRWPPSNIADTPAEALARLFVLPGSHYEDPKFSWKYSVAPAGIGFVDGRGLGAQFDGNLIVGAARDSLEGGYLFHFNLTGNRKKIAYDDPDRVADNLDKFDITESESLLFGRDFGTVTDIQTGPNGHLFVVSLSEGAIYEISRVSR